MVTLRSLSRIVKGVLGVAAIVVLAAGQASAGPFALGFEQRSGFLNDPPTSPTFVLPGLVLNFTTPTPAGFPANTFSNLDWEGPGDPGNPSALRLDVFTSSNSPTRGNAAQGDTNADSQWDSSEWFTITRLTQTNNVIDVFGSPLWRIIARSVLTIFTDPTLTTVLGASGNDVPFEFNETNNFPPGGVCSEGPSNPHGTQCDDFYRVNTNDLLDPVLNIPLGGGLFLDLTFRLFPMAGVIIEEVGPNTFAYTAELAPGVSILDIQAHWAIRRAPAPSTLALLGLGLVIAAVGLRRRVV